MRIALAQIRSTTSPRVNLALVTDAARQAVQAGADAVVFPEATMCSFLRPPAQIAEPFDGPWASAVRELARELGITVVAGMFTTAPGGLVHNTLLATGGTEARYDKIHLFDALGNRESEHVAPGHQLVSVPLAGQQLGLAVCYDIRFPQQFIDLALGGARVMVVCASWAPGPGKLAQWRTLVIARAMDSTSFVIAVDQATSGDINASGPPTGVGHSMVAGPAGEVLLELGSEPELFIVDLDLRQVDATREALPVLRGHKQASQDLHSGR